MAPSVSSALTNQVLDEYELVRDTPRRIRFSRSIDCQEFDTTLPPAGVGKSRRSPVPGTYPRGILARKVRVIAGSNSGARSNLAAALAVSGDRRVGRGVVSSWSSTVRSVDSDSESLPDIERVKRGERGERVGVGRAARTARTDRVNSGRSGWKYDQYDRYDDQVSPVQDRDRDRDRDRDHNRSRNRDLDRDRDRDRDHDRNWNREREHGLTSIAGGSTASGVASRGDGDFPDLIPSAVYGSVRPARRAALNAKMLSRSASVSASASPSGSFLVSAGSPNTGIYSHGSFDSFDSFGTADGFSGAAPFDSSGSLGSSSRSSSAYAVTPRSRTPAISSRVLNPRREVVASVLPVGSSVVSMRYVSVGDL
jgi:hypothetical protein